MTRTPAEDVAEIFVELADTLVADFDLADFLHGLVDRCVELLDVEAAGLLLADHKGVLRVVAASSEQARLLELFEVQTDEGPCLECYHTGKAVIVPDVGTVQRWPKFARSARSHGFTAVHALPMRLRDDVIGALNLFRTKIGGLDRANTRIAQAMADVATIGLLQERAVREQEVLARQLQAALNSRILIEQAKGVLAERLRIDMERAFATIRRFARSHHQSLSTVALAVVEGSADMLELHRLASSSR